MAYLAFYCHQQLQPIGHQQTMDPQSMDHLSCGLNPVHGLPHGPPLIFEDEFYQRS